MRTQAARSAPGRTNTNTLDVRPLRVTLLSDLAQPLAGVRYRLTAGGLTVEGKSDENGAVSAVVPPDAAQATLAFWLGSDQEEPEIWEMDIAELLPIDTAEGAAARLDALGFFSGEGEALDQAVRGFQDLVGLPSTGALDPDTLKALDKLYGDPV